MTEQKTVSLDQAVKIAFNLYQESKFNEARSICDQLIQQVPNNTQILLLRGAIASALKDYDYSVSILRKAANLDPSNAEILLHLGNSYLDIKDLENACSCYKKAINIRPDYADAYNNMASALRIKGDIEEAFAIYKQAIELGVKTPQTYVNYANILFDKGLFDKSVSYFDKVIELAPDSWIGHYNKANILAKIQKHQEAIESFKNAAVLNPSHPDIYNNIANSYAEIGQNDLAIENYQRLIDLDPEYLDAYYNLGLAYDNKKDFVNSAKVYLKLYKKDSNNMKAATSLLQSYKRMCDWSNYDIFEKEIDIKVKESLSQGKVLEEPFANIMRSNDPELNYKIAKLKCGEICERVEKYNISFDFTNRKRNKVITIGYVSSDYREHAAAYLINKLFALHDRKKFKVIAYSIKNERCHYRKVIQDNVDEFVDISELDDIAAAKKIYQDQVDILVDLNGHTRHNRLDIFALKPVPIQISYLGYIGTTGADFIDYIICDKVVLPQKMQAHYSEKFLYMPKCYQVNDHKYLNLSGEVDRAQFDLPEDKFIFCCFNQSVKIEPVIFGCWMSILQRTKNSVLCLAYDNGPARNNLCQYAQSHGVDPDRIIFANHLSREDYIKRLCVCDLALDTRLYNGGTITADCLWAELPVVTMPGQTFSSRMAASLLSNIGLKEMVVKDLRSYEDLACDLASHPKKLATIKTAIRQNKNSTPLFDTEQFVEALENKFEQIVTSKME